MKRLLVLLVLSISFIQGALCQSGTSAKFGVKRLVNYLEAHELSGVDTNYIGAPRHKWAVFVNGYVSDMDFDLRSNVLSDTPIGYDEKIGRVSVDMFSDLQKQISVGLYFLGYGLSYSFDMGKGYKKNLSFTMYSVHGSLCPISNNVSRFSMRISSSYCCTLSERILFPHADICRSKGPVTPLSST